MAGKPRPKKRLAPRTKRADQTTGVLTVLPLPRRVAGLPLNEQSALTCGSVWACVRVISEGLAKLPLRAFEEQLGGGRRKRADLKADYILNVQANPETTAFQFRETALAHLLCWGNAFAEIETDLLGRLAWLWLITPDRVRVTRDERGRLVYDVRNPGGPNTALYADEILHFKGMGFDGLVGYSVIAMGSRTIGSAIAAEQAANDFFDNSAVPVGMLKHPTRLSDKAKENLEKSWRLKYATPGNRYKVAILEEGLEWAQTSLPPEDAQILQTRQFSPLEICRLFRVQPHKIAELTRATFSNIESQSREHVEDTLMPWAVRIEQECNSKLFGQQRFYTKHNFHAMLRGDSQARGEFYNRMHQMGVLSINEIRELEDLDPIGPDGDMRFVPVNLQTLEAAEAAAGQTDDEPETEDRPPADEAGEGDDFVEESTEEMIKRLPIYGLVRENCGRALRREAACLSAAAKKYGGDPERLLAWRKRFEAEHRQYLREAMAASAIAVAGDDLAAEPILDAWIEAYFRDLDAPGRAVELAADLAPDCYATRLFALAGRKESRRAAA